MKVGTGIFNYIGMCQDCHIKTNIDINGFCKDCYIEDVEKEINKIELKGGIKENDIKN